MPRLPILSHQSPGDLVLGHQSKLPFSPLVRVPLSARAVHMYAIGMSGKGKSRLISSFSSKRGNSGVSRSFSSGPIR
jgi:hypothetical protein